MLVMHHFETSSLFQALVTANDDIDTIHCTESLCDVPTKVYGRCSSRRGVDTKQVCAAIIIRDRIRPQDIVQPSIVCFQKDFRVQRPLHTSQFINGPLTISYTSMHRENLAINKAGKWKPLKSFFKVAKGLFGKGSQLFHASFIKAIFAVHESILMVATNQKNALWKSNLECKQNADHLQLVCSSIHKVAIENKAWPSLRWKAKGMEEHEQITELAMNVTEDSARL
mmetsp:Transcript_73928/g.117613  ORF Transcript_73928/g.117613 Transcript_73928/m.117613 type:complete len:226 (-) Transcript_73928:1028-1705(-)